MKKLISIILLSVLLLATVGCSCGTSCCGGKQNLPSAKAEVSVAVENEDVQKLLAYFQVNQGYVVKPVVLNADTDYATLYKSARIAVVRDDATVESLKAAGWTETAHWTDAQKASNASLFNLTVMESLSENGASVNTDAIRALTGWLGGGANSEIADLYNNELFAALKN
jgi:hypothetical protein